MNRRPQRPAAGSRADQNQTARPTVGSKLAADELATAWATWGVSAHAAGAVLAVRAQPGARVNALRGMQDGALKASVTQVAEQGRANEALVRLLAETLGLRRQQVELLSGATGTAKRFLIRQIQPAELAARVRRRLAGG